MFIEKVLKWQNIISMVIIVGFILYIAIFGNYQKTSFSDSYEVESIEPFEVIYADSGEVKEGQFPVKISAVRGETTRIIAQIPEDIDPGFAVMAYTNYSRVEIYADDVLLGTYAENLPTKFGRLVGNIRYICEIPTEYAGGTLTIDYSPLYNASLSYNTIFYGNANALKLSVIYDNMWKLIFAVVLVTVSIVSLGISLTHHAQKMPTNNWAFYHLGCFLFYLSTWIICSSDVPQLFTSANEAVSVCSFMCLAIMPIHYAAFATEILEGTRLYFSIAQTITWFFPLAEVFGMLTGLYDPPDILIVNHVLIGLTCVEVVFFTVRRAKNNVTARRFGLANVILVITAVAAIAMFYLYQSTGLDALVMGIGMSIFAGCLFFTIMTVEFEYVRELQTMQIYKELAYKDLMTGLANRGAFNERLTQIDNDKLSDDKITLLLLDINRLKVVNDTQGHEMGDRLIIGAAQCIKNAFGSTGECFRIGGDEFAVILVNATQNMEECISRLDEQIGAFNLHNNNLGLSISIGAAIGANPGTDFTTELFKEADEKMYADKKEWHRILDARA